MTPDQLYNLRNALDADEGWMASALGLSGDKAAQAIHEMEKSKRPISGPVAKLAHHIAREHNLALIEGKWQAINGN